MKVLVCSVSDALGGMERRMQAETQLLAGMGHEVVVATRAFPGLRQWQADIAQAGGRYLAWRPYKFIERQHWHALFQWLASSTLPALRREKFDLAHIAMPWNFAGLSMAHLLRRANVPFVFSVHCQFGRQPLPAHGQALVRQAMAGAVAGYAVSQSARSSFLQVYSGLLAQELKVDIIWNGIDMERFRPDQARRIATRQRLGIDDNDFVMMLCGRLDSLKQPLLALQMFASLQARCASARLLIVGAGEQMTAVKREAESLGVADRVILTGQVPDTTAYYAASDAYCSTSKTEGFALAAGEALACGLPAVLPDDDVHRSIYGAADPVRCCDLSNCSSWEAALFELATLGPEARREMGMKARRFVQEHFPKTTMERHLKSFYEPVFRRIKPAT